MYPAARRNKSFSSTPQGRLVWHSSRMDTRPVWSEGGGLSPLSLGNRVNWEEADGSAEGGSLRAMARAG